MLFSTLSLIILSPILLPIIILLKSTGEREIFFLQTRVGKNEREFRVIKFATMLKESPSMKGGTITVENDNRILPVGRSLRKWKVNELPQLINVLIGDMSLIGPRPLTKENWSFYSEEDRNFLAHLRPGLSGMGSIYYRNEETLLAGKSNPAEFYRENITPHKAQLERWYINNYNLKTYFRLIFLTIWVVTRPKSSALEHWYPTNLKKGSEKI